MFGHLMVVGSVDFLFSLVRSSAATFCSASTICRPRACSPFRHLHNYHPRLEERALLFIDMRSSTAIANARARLPGLRFVADVSLVISQAGGEIHKYVGDEVIAT